MRHALLALLMAAVLPAQAHQVWIETEADAATLYFGEYADNLRETSPGLLDKFVKVRAYRQQAQAVQPLDARKTPKGFVIEAAAKAGEALLAEEMAYPLGERKQGEQVTRTLYHPAARFSPDGARLAPHLTLDLVPTGQAEAGVVQVQAFYRGKPLPKAKVAVVTAAGWAQEHHTDANGLLSVSLPWQGTYVLELSHTDASGGVERDGVKIDRASYVTSLTLRRAQGLPALPPAPAATPNK